MCSTCISELARKKQCFKKYTTFISMRTMYYFIYIHATKKNINIFNVILAEMSRNPFHKNVLDIQLHPEYQNIEYLTFSYYIRVQQSTVV